MYYKNICTRTKSARRYMGFRRTLRSWRLDKNMHCGSKLFVGETGNICCNYGNFELERYPVPPPMLLYLLENKSKCSPHFLNSIRNYNNAFSMTSLLPLCERNKLRMQIFMQRRRYDKCESEI